MNRLASVHLFEKTPDKCGICGMDIHESNGCCRDEVTVVKLAVDQTKMPVTAFDLPSLEPLIITPSVFIASAFYNFNQQRHFHNHSPPLLSAQDTYLQISVFRI